jgi:hypothetical protein
MSIVTYNNRSIANISAIPGAAKSLTHIKTLTASSSATLSFVNGTSDVVLDSTYPIYLFKFINIHPASDGEDFQFNMSIDSGSNYNVTKTTTWFYGYNSYSIDGLNAVEYNGSFDLAQSTSDQVLTNNIGADNDQSASGSLFIYNPSSTTFIKHFMANINTYHGANQAVNSFAAGYGNTTSAINAFIFRMNSGDIDAGTIKLYGIKDS